MSPTRTTPIDLSPAIAAAAVERHLRALEEQLAAFEQTPPLMRLWHLRSVAAAVFALLRAQADFNQRAIDELRARKVANG
jgi:hypothetical protein